LNGYLKPVNPEKRVDWLANENVQVSEFVLMMLGVHWSSSRKKKEMQSARVNIMKVK
jgi:hypothetical protein